jgi:Domain of unknown function (DUF4261)
MGMSEIIVTVPGPWEERGDLMAALDRAHGPEYLFAGVIFLEMKTKISCTFDWVGHDEQLRRVYEIAGQGDFSEAKLDAVAAHRSTAVLIFEEPGVETAHTAARFARALLEAGGLAVRVESAGVAHPRERWLERWASDDPFDLYSLFVVLVGDEDRFFSCGMHNFALPDAAVPSSLGPEDGAHLLNTFNLYRLTESPTLNDGETFSLEPDSERFRLRHEPYIEGYDPEQPLYNPHGLWSLRHREPPAAPARKRRGFFR